MPFVPFSVLSISRFIFRPPCEFYYIHLKYLYIYPLILGKDSSGYGWCGYETKKTSFLVFGFKCFVKGESFSGT